MTNIYLTDSPPEDIANIITAQLEDMHKQEIHIFPAQMRNMMIGDSILDTFDTTFIDDESIASGTYVTSSYLEGTPHAHVVTLPTFSPATYGLTLIASRQLRWTITLPHTSIPTRTPDSL